MGSKTLARTRTACKGPLIVAAAVATLSVMSAVALVVTIAWTTSAFGHRTMTSFAGYPNPVTETAAATNSTAVADFDYLQSGKYLSI